MKIDILTLFPAMFDGFLNESIIKRAREKNLVEIRIINFRDFSELSNHQVDDTPYGGGGGMVLRCEPLVCAIENLRTPKSKVILMCPQGKSFKESYAQSLALEKHLILVCGHYEGFDERIRSYVDDEISIGDYVLTGGELAAAVICDSVIRLLDNAIRKESSEDDSFSDGLLEYPQYTRPVEYKGCTVPEVLLNGNHKLIREFRLKESLRKTLLRRPDLLKNRNLTKEEERLLSMLQAELAADKNNA